MDFSAFFNYPNAKEENVEESEQSLYFLQSLQEDDWQKFLAFTQIRIFEKSEKAIVYKEPNQSIFIVSSGSFDVLIPSRQSKEMQKVAEIKEGSVFGELSFLDGLPCSATVMATTPSKAFELTKQAFEIMTSQEPHLSNVLMYDLARLLSYRLRRTTKMLML